VGIVERLASFLQEHNIKPYLCGARSDPKYTDMVVNKLKKAVPSTVIADLLSLEQLTEVYRKSLLNFHPALYEAYGLTMVEAGSFGTPSIVQGTNDIGVLDFLSPEKEEIFTMNLENLDNTAQKIKGLLSDRKTLDKVGSICAKKCVSYTAKEYGSRLYELITGALNQ